MATVGKSWFSPACFHFIKVSSQLVPETGLLGSNAASLGPQLARSWGPFLWDQVSSFSHCTACVTWLPNALMNSRTPPCQCSREPSNDWVRTNQPNVAQACFWNGKGKVKNHNPRSLQNWSQYLSRAGWNKVCTKPKHRVSSPLLARAISLINVTFSGLISERVTRELLHELCFPRTVWRTLLQSDRGTCQLHLAVTMHQL